MLVSEELTHLFWLSVPVAEPKTKVHWACTLPPKKTLKNKKAQTKCNERFILNGLE
jgi:hypothetical protein